MPPTPLASQVTEVQVFRAGAVVTRRAHLDPAVPGELTRELTRELTIDGLPVLAQDDSVRLRVLPTANGPTPVPVDVRVRLAVAPYTDPAPAADRERHEATQRIARLRQRLSRIEASERRLNGITFQLPPVLKNRPPFPAPNAAWAETATWLAELRRSALDQRRGIERELREAEEALARLERRLAEARAAQDARDDLIRKQVLFRLRGEHAGGPVAIEVEYRVAGARWAPTYVLRVDRDGGRASLAVHAVVVQRTGEAWNNVKLAVSTADLLANGELPELPSLRLGRAQPAPEAPAWRLPPADTEALFAGLDEALRGRPRPRAGAHKPGVAGRARSTDVPAAGGAVPVRAAPAPADHDELDQPTAGGAPMESARALPPPMAAPTPMPSPALMASAAPPPAPKARSLGSAVLRTAMRRRQAAEDDSAASEAAAPEEAEAADLANASPSGPPTPPEAMLRYADLTMPAWSEPASRGRLRPLTTEDQLAGLPAPALAAARRSLQSWKERARATNHVTFPTGTQDIRVSSGAYDHRYEAESPIDVPCDGRVHTVPLLVREAAVRSLHIVVPRESAQVVRVARLQNPLAIPLLAGPVDVYLEDEFLVTAPLRTVPAGAEVTVGLGVEERLKVARNTHFDEEARGMLRGGLALAHRVEIELASRLRVPAEVEVRERVPIKHETDKDVEIVVHPATPPWADWDQGDSRRIRGGKRWRITLGPGQTQKLAFRYDVVIDGKHELVGGNRREPS